MDMHIVSFRFCIRALFCRLEKYLQVIVFSLTLSLSNMAAGGSTIGMLWRKVMIGPPSNEDLHSIVKIQYPTLESIASKLVGEFEFSCRDF